MWRRKPKNQEGGGTRALEEVWVEGSWCGGAGEAGGGFYRGRGAPGWRDDVEVVATVAGDAGVPDAGDEGVEGEAAVVGEIVRTHTGSSGGVERLGRTRAELAHSPPMAVAAVDSAETKATGTTKVRGPLGSERRRGRNGWRAHTQMGRPI